MRIVIAGIGSMGEQLLRELSEESGYEVVAIDADEERCRVIADTYDALVLHGDAADPALLQKAQLDEADGIVAATGSDPINTIVAMLAHREEVPRIVVKISTNALRSALDEIGVTEIITPPIAAAAKAQTALHRKEHTQVSDLQESGLRLGEVSIPAPRDGTAVGDLALPGHVVAVAVVRGDETRVALPDTELRQHDVLVLVADKEQALDDARKKITD